MQLKSARLAGLQVPGHAFMGAGSYLDKVQPPRLSPDKAEFLGQAIYMPGHSYSRSMTAVAMVSRLFMGQRPDEKMLVAAARYLRKRPVYIGRPEHSVDYYYLYYSTLAMFQMGGDNWIFWNKHVRDPLIALQVTQGENRGSWDAKRPLAPGGSLAHTANQIGGRSYTTAMAVLTLEIYYRYLPMYQ